MSPIDTLTGKSLSQFLRDNGLLMAGVAVVIMAWILIYAFVVYESRYAAKSMVIIKDSAITSRYVEPEQYYALQTTSSNSANPVLNTMGLLKSNAISDDLWDYFSTKRPSELKKVGVKTKAQWEQFFQDGSSFIKAKNMPGTDLIAIQFTWNNPVVAKEGLNVILKSFQDTSLMINRAEQISRSKFLHNQVTEISMQLDEVRKEKTLYKRKAGTVNISRESDGLAGARMELENKLNQIEAQAQGKQNEVRRYQQMLSMTPDQALRAAAIGQNSALAKLQDELYRLSQQYANLSTNLTDHNPKVQEIKAQIEQVKQDIEYETLRTLGAGNDRTSSAVADSTRGTMVGKMVEAQAEATRLQAEADVTQTRVNKIRLDIAAFPAMEEELTNIQQREASLSNALDVLRQKVMESRLKEEQTLSNVFIVDTPMTPSKAEFPTQTHLVLLSIVLGLAGGAASGVIKEQLFGSRQLGVPQWMEAIDEDEEETDETEFVADTAPIRLMPAPVLAQRVNRAPSIPQPTVATIIPPKPEPAKVVAHTPVQIVAQAPVQPVPQILPALTPQPAAVAVAAVANGKHAIPVGSLYDTLMAYTGPVTKLQSAPVRKESPQPMRPAPFKPEQPKTVTPSATVPVQPVAAQPVMPQPVQLTASEPVESAEAIKAGPQEAPPKAVQAHPVQAEEEAPAPPTFPAPAPKGQPAIPANEPITAEQSASAKPKLEEVAQAVFIPAESIVQSAQDTAVSGKETVEAVKPLRKVRSLPSFLMEERGASGTPETHELPIGLSRAKDKQSLLSADEDLMQDVAPLEAGKPFISAKTGRVPAFLLDRKSEEEKLNRLQKQYQAGLTAQQPINRQEVATRKYKKPQDASVPGVADFDKPDAVMPLQ